MSFSKSNNLTHNGIEVTLNERENTCLAYNNNNNNFISSILLIVVLHVYNGHIKRATHTQ